jgi:hypothetical protein
MPTRPVECQVFEDNGSLPLARRLCNGFGNAVEALEDAVPFSPPLATVEDSRETAIIRLLSCQPSPATEVGFLYLADAPKVRGEQMGPVLRGDHSVKGILVCVKS